MSGTPYQRPRYGTGTGRMQLPRATSVKDVVSAHNGAATILELADMQNHKSGQEPQASSMLLTDSGGVTWRLTVDTAGVLHTAKVPPR